MLRIGLTGLIGYETAAKLIKDNPEKVSGAFSKRFIREFYELPDIYYREIKFDHRSFDIRQEGGLMSALWQICGETDAGCRVDIDKVPVRQEVIEILELFDENPYETPSEGAKVILWDDADINEDPDIPVIGYLTKDRKRIVKSGDHIRYLTPFERQYKDMVDRKRYFRIES